MGTTGAEEVRFSLMFVSLLRLYRQTSPGLASGASPSIISVIVLFFRLSPQTASF